MESNNQNPLSINFEGDVTNVQIQQNVSNSSQIHTSNDNFNYEEVERVLEEISKYESLFDDVFKDEAKQAKSALHNAKDAILNKESPSKIKGFLNILKELSLKVSTSVIAKGIFELIRKLST